MHTYSYLYDTHVLSITASHSEKFSVDVREKKIYPISSSYAKVMAVLLKDLRVMFLEGWKQPGFKDMIVAGSEVEFDGWGSKSDTWPGPKVAAILRKARKIGVFVGENKLVLYFLLILKKT